MNKKECLDEIINNHKGLFSNIEKYPSYDLYEGLPNIDLEIRTLSTITLYVFVDMNQSEDLLKDIAEARTSLKEATWQIRLSNEIRPIRQLIQFYNIDEVKLLKYHKELANRSEKQRSKFPQQELHRDTPSYSTATPYARRMGKQVLN